MLLALTVAATAPPILVGQRLGTRYPHWEARLLPPTATAPRLFPEAPDYRWEGLVVGGVVVGVFGAALGGGLCGYDDSASQPNCLWPTIEGFMLGALIGGVTGGLLGSLIPKTPPDSSRSP